MWSTLAQLAMEHDDFAVAARCYAALGNVSKARYLNQVVQEESEGSEAAKAKVCWSRLAG